MYLQFRSEIESLLFCLFYCQFHRRLEMFSLHVNQIFKIYLMFLIDGFYI